MCIAQAYEVGVYHLLSVLTGDWVWQLRREVIQTRQASRVRIATLRCMSNLMHRGRCL